jgi:hypothetical protein
MKAAARRGRAENRVQGGQGGGGGRGIDRVFITGVSPVVLSDMTSGYNVGEDIYLEAAFNDLCGFTEAEIAAVLERLAAKAGHGRDEALDLMRTFYNGYCFSEDAGERLYNPTLSLYFLKALQTEGRYPRHLLDENLAMDRGKLRYIAELPHGEDLLVRPSTARKGSSFRNWPGALASPTCWPPSRINRSWPRCCTTSGS